MLDTTVWIAQIFLGLFFFAGGIPKVLGRGIDRWVGFDDLPRGLTLLIGVAEMAAGVALVVPMLVDELQWTTPLAAMGLVAVALQASGFHIRAAEWLPATETALWASLAGSIAIARWDELPTGPSLSADLLVPVIVSLVAAILINLAILFRQPVPSRTLTEEPPVPSSQVGRRAGSRRADTRRWAGTDGRNGVSQSSTMAASSRAGPVGRARRG